MRVDSVHETGGKGVIIATETSLTKGLPVVVLVGFAGRSLDESRERIRSAFTGSGLTLPKKRITVNVSPSDIPKDGSHYDLPIALSILTEAEIIKPLPHNPVVLGELGLDGSIKPVRGILGKIISAMRLGRTHFILPEANMAQARLIEDIHILPATTLKKLVTTLSTDDDPYQAVQYKPPQHEENERRGFIDFSEVIGQARAKRALEIAVAGGHNVLLNGPPGVGKSMLAKAVPGIMTPSSKEEIVTVTHLHSLTNDTMTDLVTTRPFRAPHHSSSDVSIIGGGQRPRPGEVSLAHSGVLFLDELPEFKRSTIESLRQPLEDGTVTVARAKNTATYPAEFMLIATKNPCPCGFYGSTRPCTCSPIDLQRYQKKLSGPILDRIDIHVTVDNIEHKNLLRHQSQEEPSAAIKLRVIDAHKRQQARFNKGQRNGNMSNRDIKKHVKLTDEAKEFIDLAAGKLDISARVYMKMIKLARTIADLDHAESVSKTHIAEALQYRPIAPE